jgi:hypothetical protein
MQDFLTEIALELGFIDRNHEVHVGRTGLGCWDVSPAALAERGGGATADRRPGASSARPKSTELRGRRGT